jgi:S1-C subfamily serine protease
MTICPQCGYERTKNDEIINPAECPKCGIIYEKWKPTADTETEGQNKKTLQPVLNKTTQTNRSTIERKLIIAGALVAVIILVNSFLLPLIIKQFKHGKNEIGPANQSDYFSETAKENQQYNFPEVTMSENRSVNIPQKEELSLSDIIKRNIRSVVVVKTPRGMGSGFFISDQGYIVTNKHVLSEAANAEIKTAAGNKYKIDRIVAEDPVGDLVIASSEAPSSEALPVALSSRLPEVGEKVIVIGSPLGLEQTVSDGIVSAVRSNQQSVNYIQITAPISMGNSGGPVLNMRGEVIGIATFQYRQGQNLNFCVAAERVVALQSGYPLTANQSSGASFKTQGNKDVYCYMDSQGVVNFVDWKTGMMISRPDGSLDRAKFEKWALDSVGGNPDNINPQREAQEELENNREQLFKSIFPNRSMSDKNFTYGEQQLWENTQRRYYVDTYNKAMARRNEAVRRYINMLRDFDGFNNNRR